MGAKYGDCIWHRRLADTCINHRRSLVNRGNRILGILTNFSEQNLLEIINVFKLSDLFILLAVTVSFFVSAYLWFQGFRELGIFTAIWVPSILAFGIYFKLAVLAARREVS
jgi:hypothetical protein